MSERRDRIRVHIENKEYSVVGGEFQEMLAAVKQVVGRRFVSELKVWQLPGKAEDIQNQLSISGFELEGGAPIVETPPPVAATQSGPSSDRIRIQVGDHRLAVIGGAFREMLEAVKSLPGRRFDGNTKIWEVPGDVGVIKGLIEAAGYQLEGAEQIDLGPVPEMETPHFGGPSQEPPSFEEPDFGGADLVPPMQPPDWWDDNTMPPPLTPDEWPAEPDLFDEPNPFVAEPSPPTPVASPSASPGGDRIRIRLGEASLVVTGGAFQEILTTIKTIPGRRFNGQEKIWEIPDDVTLDSVTQAMSAAGLVVMEE